MCAACDGDCRLNGETACPLDILSSEAGTTCFEYIVAHPSEAETAVMQWAEANPEPRYPSLIDALIFMGFVSEGGIYDALYRPVDPLLAEKYGIPPVAKAGGA